MEAAAWGFIGTLVGALASIGTSWLATRAAVSAQREKVELDWRVQHKEFQVKAVTELQEVLGDFVRSTGKIRHVDEMREAHGHAGKPLPVDEDLSEQHAQLLRRISVLVARVDDQAARDAVMSVRNTAVTILIGVGVGVSTMLEFSDQVEGAQEALRGYLRAIYAERFER